MPFDAQPFLKNDLVQLRPLRKEDFNALFKVASDPLLWKQHQNKKRYTLEKFQAFFKESLESGCALCVIDAISKKIIGSSRFKIIDSNQGIIEIGWSFLQRQYWGGTYNRAFKKLMINYALKSFKKVIFYVHPKNFRSQRALEKLGAVRLIYKDESWVLPEDKGITYVINALLD